MKDRTDVTKTKTGAGSPIADVLPLSPLQEGLMFHALLASDPTAGPSGGAGSNTDVYTVVTTLHLDGEIDPPAMRAAGQALLERHPNLRAGFRRTAKGAAVAVIPGHVDLPWEQVDLSHLPPAGIEEAFAVHLAARRAEPFDLAHPPLLRMSLVRTGSRTHRLVLVHHHILLDGWSVPLLVRDLLALHAAGGSDAGLPPVRPYRDYLAWLAGWDTAAARTAWQQALDGLEGATRLTTGRADGVGTDSVPVDLPAGLGEQLTALARSTGVTVNTLVQTAWGLLLRALTGRADVVFGITVSGRPPQLPGVESMIGLFINTVPVRIRVDPAQPVAALLARVQDEQAALMDHQYLGLAEIQRAAGGGELFDTLLVFENYPDPDGEETTGMMVSATDQDDATHYPLVLVAEAGRGLHLELRHDRAVVGAERARDAAVRLVRVLEALVAGPDRPVAAIDVLDAAERAAVRRPEEPYEKRTFGDLFERARVAGPGRVALVFEETELTYAELDRASNRLAHRLLAAGAGPDRLVAVALPRSAELVVAMLAVLKSGSAYLALDLDHPAERIGYMLDDAAPAVLVTDPESFRRLPGVPESVLYVEDREGKETTPTAADLGRPLDVRDAAYVIYTSGSTGRPKAVVVTHEGVVKLLATATGPLGLETGSRVLQFASPSFDVFFFELCMGLLHGARLVVTPAALRVADQPLADHLRRHGITHAILPPALLTGLPAGVRLPAGITTLAGTEAVPPALVDRYGGDRPLFNAYGPTEATVNSTLWRAEPGRPGPVPIGRPDPQVRAYVLDAGLQPVLPGVPGELYLAGNGLARGYLGRPGLTSERFVADPFLDSGTRMYRTGDLVRRNSEGALEFLGRVDDQIKIRGFRIEPGEIEAVLGGVPGVRRALVTVREDEPGRRRLVAYLLVEKALETAHLRDVAAARLPDHMVPAAFVPLEDFPVTTNGKIDLAALPAPDFGDVVAGREPRTPRESLLRDLFADLLGVPGVGVDDDFFAVGGDSIVAMQLVSRARRAGLKLTARQVFERRTVAALATVAAVLTDADGRIPARVALIRIEDDESAELAEAHPGLSEVLPLSPLQEGLLFHAALDPDADVYTVQTVLELSGEVDADRLRAAGQALLERHPNLRAGFGQLRSGQSVALVPVSVPLPWSYQELSEAEFDRLMDDERNRPFDVTRPPLLRLVLVRLAPRSYRLLMTVHHLLIDGWSRSPLLAELSALYADPASVRPSAAPYRNYLAWLAGQDPDRSARAWRDALAGLDEPTRLLPVTADAFERPAQRDRPVRQRQTLRLSKELTARLVTVARERGLTLTTLVQGAWGILLGRLTGCDDVVFGTTVAGRPAELDGVESMIGLFINTVPVRVRGRAAEPVERVLARLQEQQAALIEHQHLGLARIQREAGLGELFDTLVVVENYPDQDSEAPTGELRIDSTEGRDATHYPLTWLVELGEQLVLDADHRPDRFDPSAIEQIIEGMRRILGAFADDPGLACGRIDVFGTADRLPDSWTGEAQPVPEQTLAGLFATQAARTPAAVALRFEGAGLTYAELDARVEVLARVLAGHGVSSGDVVGVALARSVELVVALLAVHRAGAAYLPLDVELPPSRVEFMVVDARPVCVIAAGGFFGVPVVSPLLS